MQDESTTKKVAKKVSKKPTTEPKKEQEVKRSFRHDTTVHHDLFRLELAQTKKNISYKEDSPLWEAVEHKHFFHSVDSDGKAQNKCVPSAGHYHYVNIKEIDGELIAEVSKPYTMRIKKGKKIEVEYSNDKHTHDATYLLSEEVKRRIYTEDAMRVISQQQNAEANRMKNPLA